MNELTVPSSKIIRKYRTSFTDKAIIIIFCKLTLYFACTDEFVTSNDDNINNNNNINKNEMKRKDTNSNSVPIGNKLHSD